MRKAAGYIYTITNAINGKQYVGQTIRTPEARWKQHLYDYSQWLKNKLKNTHLKYAFKKHGVDNFAFSCVLSVLDVEDLNNIESEFIKLYDTYNNGYNMTLGGEGGRGLKHTDEWKAAASKRVSANPPMKGKTHTPEARRKISEAHKGRKLSPERIEQIRINSTGRLHTSEAKAKMSLNAKENKSHERMREGFQVYIKNRPPEEHPMYGKKVSEKRRKQISETKSGIPVRKDVMEARLIQYDNNRINGVHGILIDNTIYRDSKEAQQAMNIGRTTVDLWVSKGWAERINCVKWAEQQKAPQFEGL